MKISTSLVDENSIERIATNYETCEDEITDISLSNRHLFRKLIQQQFADLSKIIYFDFVDSYPYAYDKVDEMIQDFRNGVIKVNTSGNDSRLWGKVYNLQFRAIHDFIHCLHKLNFNFFDEVKAYNKQIAFSMQDKYALQFPHLDWDLYQQVLRSEIIYQAAVKTHFKQFDIDTQKIILDHL